MPVPWVIKTSRDHRRRLGLYEAAAAATGGWWDPNAEGLSVWAAYAAKGAADLTASYTDLSGEGHDAGVGVAPTWDAVNGWIFNGTDQYLTAAFTPQNDQTQTAIAQFTNFTGDNDYLFGSYTAANTYFGVSLRVADAVVRYVNGQNLDVGPNIATGNLAVAGNTGYRNGIADLGTIGAWAGASTHPFYIGVLGGAWTGGYCPVYIQALAIYDTALTAPQVSAVATAMAAL